MNRFSTSKKTLKVSTGNATQAENLVKLFIERTELRIPAGCAACGNPAYPACKTSCPMFDD